MPTDLTTSQRKRLAQVSPETFQALRQRRRETLLALHAEGLSLRVMAAELGVPHPTVIKWMREPEE